MISAALFLALAGVAFAQPLAPEVRNINDRVDKEVEWHNGMIQGRGLGVLNFKPEEYGPNTPLAIAGVDSVHRNGDCFETTTDGGFKVSCNLGLRLMAFVYKNLTIEHDAMSAVYRVGKNSFDLEISVVKNESACKATLDRWAFTDLADTTLLASLPQYDQNEPEGFVDAVKAHLNAAISRPEVHKMIETNLAKFYCP